MGGEPGSLGGGGVGRWGGGEGLRGVIGGCLLMGCREKKLLLAKPDQSKPDRAPRNPRHPPQALEAAVKLSHRYIADRFLPDKVGRG